MRALVLQDGELSLAARPAPEPAAGEAVIAVELAGVCDTDLQLERGYMGFSGIPGHEFVGRVVHGEGWVGKRVVGEINAACGRCERCARGLGRHCDARTVLGILGRDGAHAELLRLPLANLHEVPAGLSSEAAVFTEPLAAACEILEQVRVEPGHRVAVVGDGKLGLLCAQVLALTGCELHVLGHHAAKLARLSARGIPTELVPAGAESRKAAGWADIVVEATGHPSGFASARRLLAPRGTLVLKTTVKDRFELDLADLVINEIRIVGSRCGPFDAALRLLERGLVDVSELVCDELNLDAGVEAYRRAAERGALKVLLRP